ncbi:hypothetical protein IP86_00580 [Rhodopseudomonas sp. AAP120]|uniref:DUF5413 family protein n=1 Tax=Rhodopseudomonas sp. AAP120 TaxID=1523430 RepID=UPI0006B8A3F9|nr:DUF5413 family protein [Rhodopseudomonas sp. AAP120]KPG02133.1 hypothetical protein IP86_00580 [Rhodopseudomonas sp. AAP120]
MKRYLIFGAIGPFVGGLLLLFATSYLSGYWMHTDLMEVQKFFVVMFKSLQYSYLFGLLPALMMAAIDEIICHIRIIKQPLRMVIVGIIGFIATAFMYSNRGADAGLVQLVLYGLVGLVPAVLSSWLVCKFCKPVVPPAEQAAA